MQDKSFRIDVKNDMRTQGGKDGCQLAMDSDTRGRQYRSRSSPHIFEYINYFFKRVNNTLSSCVCVRERERVTFFP